MRIILLITFLAFVSGCGTTVVGKKMDPAVVSKITVGVTTKDEMIAIFGEPANQFTDDQGRLVVSWRYLKSTSIHIGSEAQSLSALFDEQNRVLKYHLAGN